MTVIHHCGSSCQFCSLVYIVPYDTTTNRIMVTSYDFSFHSRIYHPKTILPAVAGATPGQTLPLPGTSVSAVSKHREIILRQYPWRWAALHRCLQGPSSPFRGFLARAKSQWKHCVECRLQLESLDPASLTWFRQRHLKARRPASLNIPLFRSAHDPRIALNDRFGNPHYAKRSRLESLGQGS